MKKWTVDGSADTATGRKWLVVAAYYPQSKADCRFCYFTFHAANHVYWLSQSELLLLLLQGRKQKIK